ncbi:MAG: hypothetical protein ACYC65_13865, partial [Candidatus Limnocylindrales bacterium]
FAVLVEGDIGVVVLIRATGHTITSAPDDQGCVRSETPTGRASVTIEAIPVPPVAISLDTVLVSNVCSATATPGPAITPPATDVATPGNGPRDASIVSLLGLLCLVVLAIGVAAMSARRRRS